MITTFNLGAWRIDRIIEQEVPGFDPFEFFPNLTPEDLEEHRAMLEPVALHPSSGLLTFAMQSYVVRTGEFNVLIDTCIGNHKERPTRPLWHMKTDSTYMDALNRAGLSVEDIDFVMCTHLHPDHIGWNTQLKDGRWVPTFPNAKYVFSEKELAHWTEFQKQTPTLHFTDSVLPIVEAGMTQLVETDAELVSGIELIPTPGHTPDHFAVKLTQGGKECVVTGDLIHSPLQCACTHLHARPDTNPEQARATRNAFMDQYAETDTLIATMHFPSPSLGHFVRSGNAFRFRYAARA